MKKVLFFTCCNEPYFHFAALYPLFALTNNKNSIVEIGVTDLNAFKKSYLEIIELYEALFPKSVKYTEVTPVANQHPSKLRFIHEPISKAEHVYICDVDIIFLDKDFYIEHINNINKYNLDYSNTLRKKAGPPRLTGLHFIEYDKMYPLEKIAEKEITALNDEAFLYLIMQKKNFKVPSESYTFRPIHGIHCSLNRPIFRKMPFSGKKYISTKWRIEENYSAFLKFTKHKHYKFFLEVLNPHPKKSLKIIQLLQILECACHLCKLEVES